VAGPSPCECSDGCSKIVAPEHLVCPDCGSGTVWLRNSPRDVRPAWLCLFCRVVYVCAPGFPGGVLGIAGLFDDDASFRDWLRGQGEVLSAQFPPGFL